MEIINLIYGKLLNCGFSERMSRFISMQAAHETGGFKSALLRSNNNLFGMKQPKLRQTTSAGEKNGYASYESLEKSVSDMAIYLRTQGFALDYKSIDEYIEQLYKKRYFEAPIEEYRHGMTAFYKQYYGETI
jgi:uncharacterized FlgJ-related protein